MSKQVPKWEPPPDLRFHTTEYVVEATSEEQFMLWDKWCQHYGVNFEQDYLGYWEQIGKVDDRPVCVNVFWYIIEDTFRVAFVEGTSQIVDYQMIDDWKEVVFRCIREEGRYNRHSNAANFGHIIMDMSRRLKRNIIRRDYDAIEKAIRAIPLKERPYED